MEIGKAFGVSKARWYVVLYLLLLNYYANGSSGLSSPPSSSSVSSKMPKRMQLTLRLTVFAV